VRHSRLVKKVNFGLINQKESADRSLSAFSLEY